MASRWTHGTSRQTFDEHVWAQTIKLTCNMGGCLHRHFLVGNVGKHTSSERQGITNMLHHTYFHTDLQPTETPESIMQAAEQMSDLSMRALIVNSHSHSPSGSYGLNHKKPDLVKLSCQVYTVLVFYGSPKWFSDFKASVPKKLKYAHPSSLPCVWMEIWQILKGTPKFKLQATLNVTPKKWSGYQSVMISLFNEWM